MNPPSAPTSQGRKTARSRGKANSGPILAPTDFSPESLIALDYASARLGFLGGRLHLVHVHEVDYAYAAPSLMALPPLTSSDEITRFYQQKLKKLAAKYSSNGATECHVRVGRAFDEIGRLADEIEAQLIVIATHGRTGLRRIFLGSTAERVVQYARCPVLVVREQEQARMTFEKGRKEKTSARKKILVPVDFSECSREGLNYALSFARAAAAEVVLLHTIQVQSLMPSELYTVYRQEPSLGVVERAAKAQMRKLVRQTDFGDVRYETDIQIGRPADRICQYAEDRAADLIITSTHGHTGLAHVLIGSTAEHVVRYAPCPVLVVPRLIAN